MTSTTKIVIITGCSSGIGLAATKLFVEKGYNVFGLDVADFAIEMDDKVFSFHKADLCKDGAIEAAVEACVKKFGPPTTLLNIAGVMDAFEAADTVSDAQWDRQIAVNLTAPVKLMRAVLPHMQAAKQGAIVNVCSRAAIGGACAGVAYTASKHGLLGATKNTAWRFRKERIRVNAVLPGAIATGIGSSISRDSFDKASYAECLPVTNLTSDQSLEYEQRKEQDIQPEAVAKSIYFLASEDAGVLTGVCMPVDKGWSTI
ncbi:putative short chain dehydrogenase/oxidoreductase [Pseudovirgaria hyperparasitica]|uniref:Putative short chain dehydrogenase/oxidoreductase n=1 Tax=Pseudovirgaria hyperparasitica TaxID=470096 RepID=A0A6A6WLL0_9PEZI|nr:putative short chain dehydrogenase/oxidoreductase [Pseudovirgaria hyperparasitica]KAF2763071.1 putative short chain dehydrogenase/oxidoreductase [Pseudovirgaria hyperparasitica]